MEVLAPIALDEAHNRLFVGARQPAELAVFNATTGSVVPKVDINSDTDDLFYDPARKLIYVSWARDLLTLSLSVMPIAIDCSGTACLSSDR